MDKRKGYLWRLTATAKFYVSDLKGLFITISIDETLRFQAIDLHVSTNLVEKRRKIFGK